MTGRVVLYGASGHTGQFVAAEMTRRGWNAILAGRDLTKVRPIAERLGVTAVQANVGNADQLDRLLDGAGAVINAAGPFGDTSGPLIEASLRARIPYFDVTAEPFVAKDIFETFDRRAKDTGTIVAPAFGFFGALGDLLASAALGDWKSPDTIELAFALDRWRPTNGTRLAGALRAGRRLVRIDGETRVHDPSLSVPRGSWQFEEPFGNQPVVGEFSTVDVVTLSQHIDVPTIATWINEAPLADLTSADISGPQAIDDLGRSAQRFAIDAVVRRGSEVRTARASGRDIYAITAPIVCQALEWVLAGRSGATGCLTAAELFSSRDFLNALTPVPLSISMTTERHQNDSHQRIDA